MKTSKTIPEKSNGINHELDPAREARLAMIQMLIPVGLDAVAKELKAEVEQLAGPRYSRGTDIGRWGSNAGSVYLGDQKVRMRVPRVRSAVTREEVPLAGYRRLQQPGVIEEAALRRVISGISTGRYERAALSVPQTFGITRNSVSRTWIRASAQKLRMLQERSLKEYDIVALILDGKAFGENEIITALGVTLSGDKVILGFIEAGTECYEVCRDFLNRLLERGLCIDQDILVVIDGGKGLHKAVRKVLKDKAFIQRCQWHKRENVVGYLNKEKQPAWRHRLQAAYETPDYATARSRLMSLKQELSLINVSAVRSLEEGLEETLTLHRLGLFQELGTSFKTTNMIENINSLLQKLTGRVTYWKTSDQRQRWVATALLEIEPRLHAVKGYRYLPKLRQAMKTARQHQMGKLKRAA